MITIPKIGVLNSRFKTSARKGQNGHFSGHFCGNNRMTTISPDKTDFGGSKKYPHCVSCYNLWYSYNAQSSRCINKICKFQMKYFRRESIHSFFFDDHTLRYFSNNFCDVAILISICNCLGEFEVRFIFSSLAIHATRVRLRPFTHKRHIFLFYG